MPQDILITPYKDSTSSGAKIEFTGLNSGASTITMRVLSDSTLSYEGTAGQLFSISNGLSSGTIFSVNDISGVPSIDVVASGLIRLAPFVGEVQTNKLYVQANPQSGTQTVQEWRNLSGAAMASINTSGQFAGYLASGTGVGGSSGQIQFNAGGTIGGSAAVTFSSGTSHLNVNAQATNIVPLRITVNSGHSANAFQIIGSGSLTAAAFDPTGVLYCSLYTGLGTNTLINATIPDNSMQRSVIIGQGAYSASGQIGELVAIGYGASANRYGVAVGQSASAAANSIALGLQASASNANVSIAIGQLSNAAFANSCGIGSRATPAAAGDLVWATELQNPTIRTQRFDASNNISYLFAGASTWIDSTAVTKTSRFTLSTYYTTTAQEAIRIDSASDLARVGIGGAASGRLCVYTGAAANKGIVVQGSTSQSANLTEWQNSAGSVLTSINASGSIGIGISSVTALLDISSSSPTVVPQKISLTSGATSNALEVYISGALQSYIRPHGGFYFRTNGLFEWSKSVVSLDNSSTDTFLIQGVANANSAGTNSIVMRGYGAGSAGNTERADTRALLVGLRSGNAFAVQGTGRVAVGANYATDGPNATTDYRGIFIVENSIGIQQTFPSGRLHVNTASASLKGIIVQGFTSQTENLIEMQDSAGNYLGAMNAGGSLSFEVNSPNISGTVSNLVTSGSYFVRLNCTWSGSALTGVAPITGGSHINGKLMRLYNGGTQPMKLTNMATSTATNRFYCYNSGDLWLSVGDYYECIYDTIAFNGTSSGGAWRVNA